MLKFNGKIIRIGTSKGLVIPKVILDLYKFEKDDEIELIVEQDGIKIKVKDSIEPKLEPKLMGFIIAKGR